MTVSTIASPPRQLDPEDLEALKRLCRQLWLTAKEHGFHHGTFLPGEVNARHASFGERLLLIITELVEVYEEYRDGRGMTEVYFKNDKPEGVPIEMADVFIRLADLVVEHNIPITMGIAVKDRYNQTREYRHGKVI